MVSLLQSLPANLILITEARLIHWKWEWGRAITFNRFQNKLQSPYHDLRLLITRPLLIIWSSLLQLWFFNILFQPHQLSCCSPNIPRLCCLWAFALCVTTAFENFPPDISLMGLLFFFFPKYCSNEKFPNYCVYITTLSFSLSVLPS